MLERAQYKQEARDLLRDARVSPSLLTLIYLVILAVITGLDRYTSLPATVAYLQEMDPQQAAALPPALLELSIPPAVSGFVSILGMMLSITLGAGMSLYHLGIRRRREMPLATLFDGFGMVGRVVVLGLLQNVLIYLGFLLLFVPGIVLAYRYRFAMYNLLENPELRPIAALRMSAAQTAGFKLELFLLDLSFLGWVLLFLLTFGIAGIWVLPYYQQTNVGYFQAIKSIRGIGQLPDGEQPDDPFSPRF